MSDRNNKENRSSKKYPWTLKRVLAWVCIIVLAAMYIITLILALLASPTANTAFKASLLITIFLPIFSWILIWFVGYLNHKKTIASMDILNSNPNARKEMEEAAAKFSEKTKED